VLGAIVGTGPSLASALHLIPRFPGRLFILNNCWSESWVQEHYERHGIRPVWLACDPAWHAHYGPQPIPQWLDAYHWDRGVCAAGNYRFIEGIWHDGLWLRDKTKISLNHGSAPQLLNLAVHFDCDPILLLGHDFSDATDRRHYFDHLSDRPGEYPEPLRKWSKFIKGDGRYDMLAVYKKIADQPGRPEILNCTQGSRLPWFEFRRFEDFLYGA
jgi:hypothetical protein